MLSRYLPKASAKDKDHDDDDWIGKDRFKHYPYVREILLWGTSEFVKLVCVNLPLKILISFYSYPFTAFSTN